MSQRDRILVSVAPVLVVFAAFWMLALSPKRKEAKDLAAEVATLQDSVQQAKDQAVAAAVARTRYPDYYEAVVRLGKAVPEDDDTPALLIQLNRIAKHAGVQFRTIELKALSGGSKAPSPPPTTTTPKPNTTTTPSPSAPAPTPAATEASAASLPLGAAIGPAGFPVMPYKTTFRGNFFRISRLIHELDELVRTSKGGQVSVRGRLITIDGFSLVQDKIKGFPSLEGAFFITTYITPKTEGLTAGATPGAPGTATPAAGAPDGTTTSPATAGTP